MTGIERTMSSATIRRKNANRVSSRHASDGGAYQTRRSQVPRTSSTIQAQREIHTLSLPDPNGPNRRRRSPRPGARVVAGVAAALLLCIVLASLGISRAIGDEASALGFDAERASFLQYALTALVGSLAAGFALRSRMMAWLGGLLYYIIAYLIPYIAQTQQPVASAGGITQRLVPGALAGIVAALLSVGIIATGAGAVLGQACGELAIGPFVILVRFVSARVAQGAATQPKNIGDVRRVRAALPPLLLAGALSAALVLAAANVGAILTYGTSAPIYQPVQVAIAHGVVRSGTYKSTALGGRMRQFLIYLPPSYFSAPLQRYPVIYLLHGAPGAMSNWFEGGHADVTANDLFALDKARETILVAPDGGGPLYKFSEWANSANGRQRMEDAIAHDLVTYIDAHYRTIASPAGRTLAGLSDGGYGATNIALHHPDEFGAVLSLGGFYRAVKSPVFGSGPLNDSIHRLNSPAEFVTTPEGISAVRSIHFYIGVSRQDHGYYQTGLSFYQELKRLGARAELISMNGTHSWWTWSTQFTTALPLLEPPLPGRHAATHPS